VKVVKVLLRRLFRALTRNDARTDVSDLDARLRGRTYHVPFDTVWNSVYHLAAYGLRRWRLVSSDDYEGVIHAEARTRLFRHVDDVTIRVALDHNAQTRVDVESRSRTGWADLGANARRIGRFLKALDKRLAQREAARSRPQAS
jgi:uncharacterized protein (DUF1499 family)